MSPIEEIPARNLSLRDLGGLVAGFSLAGYLLRYWGSNAMADPVSQGAFWLAYLWFGVAMSGPMVLWLVRLSENGKLPPREPQRLGRLIADVPVGAVPEKPSPQEEARRTAEALTFNETLWLGIGGFWTTITLFLPTPIGWDLSWAVVATVPLLVVLALGPWILGSIREGSPTRSWTHPVATAVIFSWPFASLMLLLSTGMYGK